MRIVIAFIKRTLRCQYTAALEIEEAYVYGSQTTDITVWISF
jgi:hypothetical protein